LWFVEKSDDNEVALRERVPAEQAEALREIWHGVETESTSNLLKSLAQTARRHGHWIACDCRSAEQVYPLFTPAYLTGPKKYFFRRLTGRDRPNHDDGCVFRFEPPLPGSDAPRKGRASPLLMPTGLFSVLSREQAVGVAHGSGAPSDRERRDRSPPPLARQLWRLMSTANLNRLPPVQGAPESGIRIEMSALRVAAERYDVVKDTALARVLATYPSEYHSNRLFARIRDAAKRWPSDAALQGFLLTYTPQITGQKLEFTNEDPITVVGELARPVSGDVKARAPYLALTVIGDGDAGLTAIRSFAQPIYSGAKFVPVDSDFERKVLTAVNKARWVLSRSLPSLEISVIKPLFDISTETGHCRPDFLIETFDTGTGEIKSLILEAMGFDLADYVAAKSRTHPIMQEIAPVYSINLEEANHPGALAARFCQLFVDGGR